MDKSVKAIKHFSGIYSWNNKNHHPKYKTYARPVRNLSYVGEQVWQNSKWKCRRASGEMSVRERSNGKNCRSTYTCHTQISVQIYTANWWESWDLLAGVFGIRPRGKLYPAVLFVQGHRIFTPFIKQNKEIHDFHHHFLSVCSSFPSL